MREPIKIKYLCWFDYFNFVWWAGFCSRDNVIQRKKKRSTEEFGSTSNIKPKLKGFDDHHEIIRSHSSNPFERDSIPSSKIKEEGLKENEDEKIEEPREKVSPVLSSDLRRNLFSYN